MYGVLVKITKSFLLLICSFIMANSVDLVESCVVSSVFGFDCLNGISVNVRGC